MSDKGGGKEEAGSDVAILSVHGVGDPAPGVPSREVANLLLRDDVLGGPGAGGSCFVSSAISLPVESSWASPGDKSAGKDDIGIAWSRAVLAGMRRDHRTQMGATATEGEDTTTEIYDTVCRTVSMDGPGGTKPRVDLYELLWADLSRAPGWLPRFLLTLYQLTFRLALHGGRAARQALEHEPDSWVLKLSDRVHSVVGWLLPTTIPLLNLFLLTLASPIFLELMPGEARPAIGAGLAALVVLLVLTKINAQTRLIGPGIVALLSGIAAAGIFLWPVEQQIALAGWLTLVLAVAWATWASRLLVRGCAWPLRLLPYLTLVYVTGWIIVGLQGPGDVAAAHAPLVSAATAIHGVFFVLQIVWFPVFAALLVLLLVWMFERARSGDGSRQRVQAQFTGVLGVSLSTTLFLLLTVVLWAVVLAALGESSLKDVQFKRPFPLVNEQLAEYALNIDANGTPEEGSGLDEDSAAGGVPAGRIGDGTLQAPNSASAPDLSAADDDSSGKETAAKQPRPCPTDQDSLACYADELMVLSTGLGVNTFLLALVLCLLILLASVLPSTALEGNPLPLRERMDGCRTDRLKRWLDSGFVAMAGAAWVLFTGLAVLVAGYSLGLVKTEWLPQTLLGNTLVTALGAAISLSVPMVLLFRDQLPNAIRIPLDIILDVDTWLNRHSGPSSYPRGKILARALSLLRWMHSTHGYRRIVIVAPSQGSVITADLLRLLKSDPGMVRRVFGDSPPDIRLITAGCPLRQLYALRFPTEYGWVEKAETRGPDPDDLFGVSKWINLYHSGDYVGRALWEPEPDRPMPLGDNAIPDEVDKMDVLLGAGAHTHYLDGDDPRVRDILRSELE
ncbi:hypothetical protein [Thiocapsa marina]|uniref:Uncharacterized protein n=2 Tax=Thiocapsa marina 5811 TaxID=768671 RepID=F9U9J7_9GAMM|nr:hypothetical protein [Thiocapsa marina]EGV18795.1 hypothetical protein ThimaDRAFT_1599 [Thiocapsa marina 5811]